ncbi:MAG TPA: AI-2E family transporter [Geminicoccus sp.]|jgi:predicted PurR-regulated permease PerM|uniref:AI-2E family transporter n=1 Tax=Geminicoccus sp. TaxID=2024832 RepID=UPI002E376FE1|nr:AI-2E family transporter [Geminicoccus sp.]HEX2527348.1 AI-2E family transporter [Geminicoccus sp.]
MSHVAVPWRSNLSTMLAVLAVGVGLFLAWKTAGTLLLIFAGLLFAVLLDACTRGLAYLLPIGRSWRLAIVCILLTVGIAWLLVWSSTNLVGQADSLIRLIAEQLRVLRGELRSMGITPPPSPDGPRTLTQLLFPDPGALFGHAYSAFNLASGLLGNLVVVAFIGLFTAASPETYRRGILSLLPGHRQQRVGEVLDEMAEVLRWWLVGQLVAVVLIAASMWAGLTLIGMPGALLLGVQAGLVNFIPYLGPVISAVPILLAAMAYGHAMVLWALGVHVTVQLVEGYVLAPLIQKRTVDVPPVLTLVAVMLAGALFGALGIALAMPLVAVLRIAVVRLYIEDRLGHAG